MTAPYTTDRARIVERLHDHSRNVSGDPSRVRLYGLEAREAADIIEQDGRTIDALRAEVKTVLQREADTIRRHDARIDAAEAERDALRAEVDAWREKYNALGASALEQVAKLGFENGRKDALIDALQADLAAADRRYSDGCGTAQRRKQMKSPVLVEVSKEEFKTFIAEYPRPLETDVFGACEPPLVSWNDFTLAPKWPESIVASRVGNVFKILKEIVDVRD